MFVPCSFIQKMKRDKKFSNFSNTLQFFISFLEIIYDKMTNTYVLSSKFCEENKIHMKLCDFVARGEVDV